MPHSLIWMPEVLLSAKLKVALVDGWEERGTRDVDRILGTLCHHTGGRPDGNMPALHTLVHGRSGLAGPLAQLGLGRDGTFYVVAAGRANHAGSGVWRGVTTGNGSFIGIEAENTGKANDQPWPAIQIDAYQRGVAALLARLGLSADACAGHKEYALPRGRKVDPSFDMLGFRANVAAIMEGRAPDPSLIPAIESAPRRGQEPRSTLRRGASGLLVSTLQLLLKTQVTGDFTAENEALVRAFQRSMGLVPDGIVGPKTWAVLDEGVRT